MGPLPLQAVLGTPTRRVGEAVLGTPTRRVGVSRSLAHGARGWRRAVWLASGPGARVAVRVRVRVRGRG